MNPVVGLDVSKGESQVQAFLDKGKPYRKSFSVMHTLDGLDRLLEFFAFAGVDPSVYSSGRFTASVNRITKRGSSRLRLALYMAVTCGIRDARKQKTTDEIIPRNKKLREFYDKKRDEGRPFRVAIIACVNKLLHWIYALLKSRTTYQDIV
jgi:Transposase IS116/IS110/IS902 family